MSPSMNALIVEDDLHADDKSVPSTSRKGEIFDAVMLSGKSHNNTSAPVEEDDSDFGRDSWFDTVQDKSKSKKRKRSGALKTLNKKSSSRNKSTVNEGLKSLVDDDITDLDSSEEDALFDFRVPKFISERKHLHVPLEAYFKAVKYDDDINDRRDSECLEKEATTIEPESMEEDEGESDGPSSGSPVARQNHVKKQEKVVLEQDDSATESESEIDSSLTIAGLTKRKSLSPSCGFPASKKQKVCDDSATEYDDDVVNGDILASSTESEDDDSPSTIHRRPPFPLAPSQQRLGPMVLDPVKHIQVPATINTYLREYQRDGVEFLWEKYKENRGGLLGDDMGLGKTIQIIAFLSAIMKKTGYISDEGRRSKHVARLQSSTEWKKTRKLPPANETWPTALIIAPSSVAMNWQRELETWAFFEVGMYTSKPVIRADVLKDFILGRLDVVITTFELAREDIEKLCDLPWSCIIVDEVHRVKNPKSSTTQKLNMFQCPVRLGLTGTAIQNNYMELWTILDWTNPGALGSTSQWATCVAKPLTVGQSKAATDPQILESKKVATILKDELLPKFFKRRTKDIILSQLPRKTDRVVFCPLTAAQISIYKRIIDTQNVQNLLRRDEDCDCGSKRPRKRCHYRMDQADIFRFLATLIKISNHVALILPADKDSKQQKERNREISHLAFGPNPPLWGMVMHQPNLCGKWLVLETLLKEWHENPKNKVLIFTKSVKVLEILQFRLQAKNWDFERLDGSTEQSERMPKIDRFHQDPNVWIFLISTLAGGTGLNLVGANKVVIFDPNWNPAHDLQAIDRAFRIGQTRDVEVFRLLGAGSIEELIYARQVYKQQQMKIGYEASIQTRYFKGVQNDKQRQGELFGLKNLFQLHEDTLATKMAIEEANLDDLDWALGHMGTKARTKSDKGLDKIRAAEKKLSEQEGSDFSGLKEFLFDDVVSPAVKIDDVSAILKNIGVSYSHINDHILKDNVVEKARVQTVEQAQRKARQKSKEDSSASEWPPRRKHHKTQTPEDRMSTRREALIGLGFITEPDDLSLFAQQFVQKSMQEQAEIFAQLDEYHKSAVPSFVDPSSYRV